MKKLIIRVRLHKAKQSKANGQEAEGNSVVGLYFIFILFSPFFFIGGRLLVFFYNLLVFIDPSYLHVSSLQ